MRLLDSSLKSLISISTDSNLIDAEERKSGKIKRKTLNLIENWLTSLQLSYQILKVEQQELFKASNGENISGVLTADREF